MTNDPDIDFARIMRAFYQAELSASEIIVNKSKNNNVIAIAKDQLEHHARDIELYDDYSHNQTPSTSDSTFLTSFASQLNQKENVVDTHKTLESQFLSLIINHHEKGILLSNHYLHYASDPFMKVKAKQIIDAHTKEIQKLRKVLNSIITQ